MVTSEAAALMSCRTTGAIQIGRLQTTIPSAATRTRIPEPPGTTAIGTIGLRRISMAPRIAMGELAIPTAAIDNRHGREKTLLGVER